MRRLLPDVRAIALGAALLLAGLAATAIAQTSPEALAAKPAAASNAWPHRAVRVVVGFAAGSSPDLLARVLAESLSRRLAQPVVVENRLGAAGNIATEFVARATDDHTLGVVINGNLASAKLLQPDLPFDPRHDLVPISLIATGPLVLVAPASLPGGRAFFDAAIAQGWRWFYGSVGQGSLSHLGMELLRTRVPGLEPMQVAFSSNPTVLRALLRRDVQMALVPPGLAAPHVESGRLQIIGLAGARTPLAPGVPSLAELGIPEFSLEAWDALVGPATLSASAQARLATEVPAILAEPAIRERLLAQGWQPVGSSPEVLRQRVEAETALMRTLIDKRLPEAR
jgi:tripartite-type tricarboxylate transporter receptor subunit TctC